MVVTQNVYIYENGLIYCVIVKILDILTGVIINQYVHCLK